MANQLLDKLKNDNDFALELQKKAFKIKVGTATEQDREEFINLIADTPEQLEKLKALNEAGPEASITITTITTLTTATTAF
ncbi:hypothetical protein [Photobacterium minamisatsumaniensis]|uniref:hypothetical protein n=1 Tax=Photobacterium minamisatsumaniensis TaxID=2910233 RepID=UPI003D0BCC96